VRPTALTSLLLKTRGSVLGETVDRTLRAAGARVTTADSPCRLLAEADRAEPPFRTILLGVDYFARDEFRLFPLLRREWPEAVLVAYHSPGFEHKGELAELLGADAVLADAHDLSRFLESLAVLSPAPRPRAAKTLAVEAEAYLSPPSAGRRAPAPPAPEAPVPIPTADRPPGEPNRTRLTDEELRLLLGEEDEP